MVTALLSFDAIWLPCETHGASDTSLVAGCLRSARILRDEEGHPEKPFFFRLQRHRPLQPKIIQVDAGHGPFFPDISSTGTCLCRCVGPDSAKLAQGQSRSHRYPAPRMPRSRPVRKHRDARKGPRIFQHDVPRERRVLPDPTRLETYQWQRAC